MSRTITNQSKLEKGRTFTTPNHRLSRIWELVDEDMVCCFCNSYFFDEVCKALGHPDYIISEETKNE